MRRYRQAIVMPEWAGRPVTKEVEGWELITDYEPPVTDWSIGVVDLSHRPKALAHGPAAEGFDNITPGQAIWTGSGFACGHKPGEVAVFDLGGDMQVHWPSQYYTDMTDAWVLVAVMGNRAVELMQRMVIIDVERPETDSPFYVATRSHGMDIQLINTKAESPCYLVACERSHGQNLADTLIRNGRHLGLKPVGLNAFDTWLKEFRVQAEVKRSKPT